MIWPSWIALDQPKVTEVGVELSCSRDRLTDHCGSEVDRRPLFLESIKETSEKIISIIIINTLFILFDSSRRERLATPGRRA